ncbi:uncharacterized protein LOC114755940 [Neltuma alba]|uniref:uncharacterized protein LOC114755940 n=1 Tax=Neltuma alba TaxID=207710 RepID=UPI0010A34B88|nr:uncharacterized protein LOC114755940 [Prosopis alba]
MSFLEITVLSVESLHRHSSPCTALFSASVTPSVRLTKMAPPTNGNKPSHVYTSDVNHKFRVSVDSTFFSDRYSSLHLQLYAKRRLLGRTQLGWCLIPVTDIGFLPSGSVRYLSYRLRDKDGCRGHGIVNLSIRLEGVAPPSVSAVNACQTVIGMPVTAIRRTDDSLVMKGRVGEENRTAGRKRW